MSIKENYICPSATCNIDTYLSFFQPPPSQRMGEKHAWSSKFSSDHQVSVCIPQKAL